MAASLTLDIGEDRILLETRSNVYHLDIYLPFLLIQADCVAQFNRRTKVTVFRNHFTICWHCFDFQLILYYAFDMCVVIKFLLNLYENLKVVV